MGLLPRERKERPYYNGRLQTRGRDIDVVWYKKTLTFFFSVLISLLWDSIILHALPHTLLPNSRTSLISHLMPFDWYTIVHTCSNFLANVESVSIIPQDIFFPWLFYPCLLRLHSSPHCCCMDLRTVGFVEEISARRYMRAVHETGFLIFFFFFCIFLIFF